jgi:hypothetical protein
LFGGKEKVKTRIIDDFSGIGNHVRNFPRNSQYKNNLENIQTVVNFKNRGDYYQFIDLSRI